MILFVSPMCLLDRGSGAAQTVRTWLELMAGEGHDCESITMSVFDGGHEYNLAREISPDVLVPENYGKFIQISRDGVRHKVFYTGSTVGSKVTQSEQQLFFQRAAALMDEKTPDLVISYGSSSYTRRLQDMARDKSRRFLFYLANAGFAEANMFAPADIVVCPSQFLADHYRHTLGLNPFVVRTVIKPQHGITAGAGTHHGPENQKFGFITYVNPQPDKGLTLFLRLVRMAYRERPEFTFLAVEGRVSRENLRKIGVDPGAFPNVWWLPNQDDMGRVYARTCLLVCPSFCNEAAGRVVAEALLAGIPVLAANRGGIPEQINGGGFLFDIPERCTTNFRIIPTEAEVRPWLDTVCHLMDDYTAYAKAVENARSAGAVFAYDRRKQAVIDFLENVLQKSNS